ncbi:MAG: GTP-dependent dephospho-CoA kinase family protein [Candidatus Baldrarchaeia archaeon]
MQPIFKLPEHLRSKLKKPLGQLIKGPPNITIKVVKEIIEKSYPPKIITVGDIVTYSIKEHGLPLSIAIIDQKTMREKSNVTIDYTDIEVVIKVTNPPATITLDAWRAIENAMLKNKEVIILVDGEEDLLALPAIYLAPEGSIILYGQPNEGIVVVKADQKTKEEIKKILSEMEGSKSVL